MKPLHLENAYIFLSFFKDVSQKQVKRNLRGEKKLMFSAGCVYIYFSSPNILLFCLRFNKKKILKESSQKRETKEKNSEWSGMEEWIRGDREEDHGATRKAISLFFTLCWCAVYFIYFLFCFKKIKSFLFLFWKKGGGPLTMAVGDSIYLLPSSSSSHLAVLNRFGFKYSKI